LEDVFRKIDALPLDEWGCKVGPWMPHAKGKVRVYVNGKKHFVPRLVLERKLGRAIRPGYFACHHCDYPACVNEDHIYEGTNKDNVRDKWERNPEYVQRKHLRRMP
jgi:hypothetical protein